MQKYYKSEMMRAASLDKIPVVGISAYNSRSLTLVPFTSTPTMESIKTHINNEYSEVSHWVSDQSKLYWWMDDTDLTHSVCDHGSHLYIYLKMDTRPIDWRVPSPISKGCTEESINGSPGNLPRPISTNFRGGGATSTYLSQIE